MHLSLSSFPSRMASSQYQHLYFSMSSTRFMRRISSSTGESGGSPRYVASPDINTEDFQAAVDFLTVQGAVDPDRIGITGICGWGGMALNAQRTADYKNGWFFSSVDQSSLFFDASKRQAAFLLSSAGEGRRSFRRPPPDK